MRAPYLLAFAGLGLSACASAGTPAPPEAQAGLQRGYRAYVAGAGRVAVVEFDPGEGIGAVASVAVEGPPADVATSPDGRHWYVTVRGAEGGSLRKHRVAGDTLVGRAELGRAPGAVGVTPDGRYLYVAGGDPEGDPVPSSVSVVYAPTLTEVARPESCAEPRGGRFDLRGAKLYSTCEARDQLVEIDTRTFEVTRRFSLAPGREGPLGPDSAGRPAPRGAACAPTWAEPGRGGRAGRYVYVACGASGEILEVDLDAGRVRRRFRDGRSPSRLEASPDGRLLVAAASGEAAVRVVDLERGVARATIPTTRPVPRDVAVTVDGRYALVTSEGEAGGAGAVDVVDLRSLARIATLDLPGGAAAIALVP